MFGEHEFDNSRSPSPWDPFLSSSPSEVGSLETRRLCNRIPKLVPEVEEGNIEYKLKLTDISPTRFARLVTQLKWRLLEGGGQAYYELGVADSGALIGLSPADLEQSLETLEMMAGEIGASVIVVKEIEVPPGMVTLADKVSEYIDPDTGEWTERMSNRRMRRALLGGDSTSATPGLADAEAELSAVDTDDACSFILTNDDISPQSPLLIRSTGLRLPSYPDRPVTQSSPLIEPLDDSLALFSMEPEPEFSVSIGSNLDSNPTQNDRLPGAIEPMDVSRWIDDMTIQAVYKPRPSRKRAFTSTGVPGAFGGKHGTRTQYKGKEKKKLPWHGHTGVGSHAGTVQVTPRDKEAKALQKRISRDKRREEKRRAEEPVPQPTPTCLEEVTEAVCVEPAAVIDDAIATSALVSALDSLHVSIQPDGVVVTDTETGIVNGVDLDGPSYDLADLIDVSNKTPTLRGGATITAGSAEGQSSALKEPRLIVEALVVRKKSLEEDFLDFGRF